MRDEPIYLDGRRTAAARHDAEKRRRSAHGRLLSVPSAQPHLESLENQMLADPAKTWIEAIQKWRFLLERYSATSGADDKCIPILIRRAIRDMERLRKCEESE